MDILEIEKEKFKKYVLILVKNKIRNPLYISISNIFIKIIIFPKPK